MRQGTYRIIPVKAKTVTVFALVSPEDYAALARFKWYLSGGYAIRSKYPGKVSVSMARTIVGLEYGDARQCDHINRDRLDNRRSNLRILTKDENAVNRGSNRNTSSPHRGVSWHSATGKWQAQARHKRVKHYLGEFHDETVAAGTVNAFWVERGYPAPNHV